MYSIRLDIIYLFICLFIYIYSIYIYCDLQIDGPKQHSCGWWLRLGNVCSDILSTSSMQVGYCALLAARLWEHKSKNIWVSSWEHQIDHLYVKLNEFWHQVKPGSSVWIRSCYALIASCWENWENMCKCACVCVCWPHTSKLCWAYKLWTGDRSCFLITFYVLGSPGRIRCFLSQTPSPDSFDQVTNAWPTQVARVPQVQARRWWCGMDEVGNGWLVLCFKVWYTYNTI
jgi:hypothetical protein